MFDQCRYIIRWFCLRRNPMPDYYSVTLEVARDRVTRAWTDTCMPDKHEKGVCPETVFAGEQFLHRTLNEPCEKMVSWTNVFLGTCRVESDKSNFACCFDSNRQRREACAGRYETIFDRCALTVSRAALSLSLGSRHRNMSLVWVEWLLSETAGSVN